MAEPEEFPQVPAALKPRVLASLRANGVLRRQPHWSRVPLALAAGVALFVAGTQMRRLVPPAASAQPAFALLLYEDAAFQPTVSMEQIVSEYTAWAEAVEERGDLVLAEELDPVVQVAGPGGTEVPGPLGQLTGMFVVHAADRDAALALARHHPHVQYGGRIVVRGFVRRG
jgi:hypothetical protein